jgi:hypothetical protein
LKITHVLLAATAIVSASAAVAAPAWEFTSPGQDFSNGTWNFAYSFSVNTAVAATGLGYYASPTNGQVANNPVALYECSDITCSGTGTLIASAIVTNVYALVGHFRYVTVAPVNLTPGVGYQVAGVSNGNNYTWNNIGFAPNPLVNFTYGQDRWLSTGTLQFLPTVQGITNEGFWGPNVFLGAPTFANVPEPTTWAMLIAGFGLTGAVMRRRRSVAAAA